MRGIARPLTRAPSLSRSLSSGRPSAGPVGRPTSPRNAGRGKARLRRAHDPPIQFSNSPPSPLRASALTKPTLRRPCSLKRRGGRRHCLPPSPLRASADKSARPCGLRRTRPLAMGEGAERQQALPSLSVPRAFDGARAPFGAPLAAISVPGPAFPGFAIPIFSASADASSAHRLVASSPHHEIRWDAPSPAKHLAPGS